jgi:RNA polymerase sigma-70 factor (ECF subfamily)
MTDAELVGRARAGDEDAFARLVDRYRDPIWAFVRQRVRDRALAEDVAQEAFVAAYTRLGALEDPQRFAGWLFGIARNLTLHALRGLKSGARVGQVGEAEALEALARRDGGGAAAAGPEVEAVEARDLAEAVAGAVGALEDPYRAALVLRFREGLSYREVADALGLAVGTVSSLIHRGLGLLAPRLAPLGRAVLGEAETEAALEKRGISRGGR